MPATLTRMSKASPCRSNSCSTAARRPAAPGTASARTAAEPPRGAAGRAARVGTHRPGLLAAGGVDVGDGDVRAGLRESQAGRPAQPARPAGDQRDAPLQRPGEVHAVLRSATPPLPVITLAENRAPRSPGGAS